MGQQLMYSHNIAETYEWKDFTVCVASSAVAQNIGRHYDCHTVEQVDTDEYPGRVRFRLPRPVDDESLREEMSQWLRTQVVPDTEIVWGGHRVQRGYVTVTLR